MKNCTQPNLLDRILEMGVIKRNYSSFRLLDIEQKVVFAVCVSICSRLDIKYNPTVVKLQCRYLFCLRYFDARRVFRCPFHNLVRN